MIDDLLELLVHVVATIVIGLLGLTFLIVSYWVLWFLAGVI